MSTSSGLSRRGLLALGATLVAGCSASSGQNSDTPSSSGSASTRPIPSASPAGPSSAGPSPSTPGPGATPARPAPGRPTVALPEVRRWTPGPGEIHPEVKALAVRATESLLHRPGLRSAIEVIDAQYGGILADSASVLVVCRQYTLISDHVTSGGTTVDVRLSKSGQNWHVTVTHPAQPGPAVANLSSAARRVLANDHILLPPASVADVRSGNVHDSVLTAMLELARTYRIGVSVIRSGHPLFVFGTTRPSDHPRGRAFDTWQLNGHPVVDPATSRSLITSYMRAAEAAGSYNVGGPYQLSGAAFFSDQTHHDHVHAGFRS